ALPISITLPCWAGAAITIIRGGVTVIPVAETAEAIHRTPIRQEGWAVRMWLQTTIPKTICLFKRYQAVMACIRPTNPVSANACRQAAGPLTICCRLIFPAHEAARQR